MRAERFSRLFDFVVLKKDSAKSSHSPPLQCPSFLRMTTSRSQKSEVWSYVEDRYIGDTVRSIFDIMDFTVKENIPGLLIFVDFQKAFDSIEWDFLVSCLEAFNFGRDFIHCVL